MLEKLAEQYATRYHEGQYRKETIEPYVVHPRRVVELLKVYGVHDKETLATAWLHDTLEDTKLTYGQIKKVFGERVAQGVHFLTRDIDRDVYKQRLLKAPQDVQLVKLCDTLDNIRMLEVYTPRGLERKLVDCTTFYIPLAGEIRPEIAEKMRCYIKRYQRLYA